jgi:tRNA(fMet)-specific endonuclease VapC
MAGMNFLLDSNVISELTRPRADARVLARFKWHRAQVCTAAPVFHELRFGVEAMADGARKTFLASFLDGLFAAGMEVLAYDAHAARWHADERARLQKIGKPPPYVDGQIASIAAVNDLILVTRNVADFRLFSGLRVKDWMRTR